MKSSWKGFYVEEGIELCSQHNSSLQLNSTKNLLVCRLFDEKLSTTRWTPKTKERITTIREPVDKKKIFGNFGSFRNPLAPR